MAATALRPGLLRLAGGARDQPHFLRAPHDATLPRAPRRIQEPLQLHRQVVQDPGGQRLHDLHRPPVLRRCLHRGIPERVQRQQPRSQDRVHRRRHAHHFNFGLGTQVRPGVAVAGVDHCVRHGHWSFLVRRVLAKGVGAQRQENSVNVRRRGGEENCTVIFALTLHW